MDIWQNNESVSRQALSSSNQSCRVLPYLEDNGGCSRKLTLLQWRCHSFAYPLPLRTVLDAKQASQWEKERERESSPSVLSSTFSRTLYHLLSPRPLPTLTRSLLLSPGSPLASRSGSRDEIWLPHYHLIMLSLCIGRSFAALPETTVYHGRGDSPSPGERPLERPRCSRRAF